MTTPLRDPRGRRRPIVAALVATAMLLATAGSALAVSDEAGCVGQFSSFFAHDGLGVHRSDVAQNFAHDARPAGANVYSHVAEFHGDLQACFDQT